MGIRSGFRSSRRQERVSDEGAIVELERPQVKTDSSHRISRAHDHDVAPFGWGFRVHECPETGLIVLSLHRQELSSLGDENRLFVGHFQSELPD